MTGEDAFHAFCKAFRWGARAACCVRLRSGACMLSDKPSANPAAGAKGDLRNLGQDA
jgi:hypothetical protein